MEACQDNAVWNSWYVIGAPPDIRRHNTTSTRLLGHRIDLTIHQTWISAECDGRPLPVCERLGYVWTTLGKPEGPPQQLIEYYEVDRLVMNIWSVPIKCSGLRIVENVIDNTHFAYVHPGILGDPNHLGVELPTTSIDENGALWIHSSKTWLPIINDIAEYTYRISDPYSVILYIHNPGLPRRYNFLGIFAQPIDEDNFIAHKLLAWVREDWMDYKQLRLDQQWISAQDKFILERQTPKRQNIGKTSDVKNAADVASHAYRQWLRDKNVRYGALL